jgi:hypothetical protein
LLQKDGEVVRVSQELPYVRGWAVDQVLSQIFGLSSLRDPDTAAKIAEYEELRLNRGAGKLTMEQTRRLGELETYLNEHLRDADDALGNWALRQDLNLLTSELKARREKSRA